MKGFYIVLLPKFSFCQYILSFSCVNFLDILKVRPSLWRPPPMWGSPETRNLLLNALTSNPIPFFPDLYCYLFRIIRTKIMVIFIFLYQSPQEAWLSRLYLIPQISIPRMYPNTFLPIFPSPTTPSTFLPSSLDSLICPITFLF